MKTETLKRIPAESFEIKWFVNIEILCEYNCETTKTFCNETKSSEKKEKQKYIWYKEIKKIVANVYKV